MPINLRNCTFFISQLDITTRQQALTDKEFSEPRNLPIAELTKGWKANAFLCRLKTISISQVQTEIGADLCVPSSPSASPNEHAMVWVASSVALYNSHVKQSSFTVKNILHDHEVLQTPPQGPTNDGKSVFTRRRSDGQPLAETNKSQSLPDHGAMCNRLLKPAQQGGTAGFSNRKTHRMASRKERWLQDDMDRINWKCVPCIKSTETCVTKQRTRQQQVAH